MTRARRIFTAVAVLILMGATAVPYLQAQDMLKTVTGVIREKDDHSRRLSGVRVYAFESKYEAEDECGRIKKIQETGNGWVDITKPYATTDAQGYYEISVNPGGALLFFVEAGGSDPMFIPVKNRMNIDVFMKMGHVLDQATVEAQGTNKAPTMDPPKPRGDSVFTAVEVFLPDGMAQDMGRFVLQPYMVDYAADDTVARYAPVVRDGASYHTTQLRRMAFRQGEDPLYLYADADTVLSGSSPSVRKSYGMKLPDHDNLYVCYADWWLEDYTRVYYDPDEFVLFRSNRLADDMRFLDFKAERYELDPNKYRQRAIRQYVNSSGSINVHFPVGRDVVDPKDTASVGALSRLKAQLHEAVSQDGATIRQFKVEGVASPEGPYDKNLSLANKRMQYIMQQIKPILPRYHIDYETSARVATWEEVADVLDADGLGDEAAQVRAICRKFRNRDDQWRAIIRLPFYNGKVMPRLEALRSVKYTSLIDIFRELTPEEIYEKYKSDPDYLAGRKQLELYEYWNLFQMIEDPKELETLSRQAICANSREVLKDGRKVRESVSFWPLPANILALSLLDMDRPDTTVLADYIDLSWRLNQEFLNNGVVEKVKNLDVLVANQVVMMFKARQYGRAGQMAKLLKGHGKFQNLYMFTRALAGYWEDDEQLQQTIIASSPRNAVVMHLALGQTGSAKQALEQMDPDDALTLYLQAQILCRTHKTALALRNYEEYDDMLGMEVTAFEQASEYLLECFRKDPSYVEVAKTDYYMLEEVIDDVLPKYLTGLEDGPFKDYLTALNLCRRARKYSKMTPRNIDRAVGALQRSFAGDPYYEKMARTDFYIFREVYDAAVKK